MTAKFTLPFQLRIFQIIEILYGVINNPWESGRIAILILIDLFGGTKRSMEPP